MQEVITALIIGLVISVSWVIWKDGVRKNILPIVLTFALIAAWSMIALLYENNRVLMTDLARHNQEVVESFSIQEQPIIIEPVLTPSPAPIITPEPKPEVIEESKRYDFTDNDIYLMARLLCGSKYKDGDGEYDFDYGNDERYDQISLVLCVVMNRVRDERFPSTVEGVITQRYNGQGYQFSAVELWRSDNVEVSDIAIKRVTEWCRAYNNGPMGSQIVPESYVYFSSNGKGVNVARPKL